LQPPKKLLGVGIAMAGIVWYTQLKLGHQAPQAVRPLVLPHCKRAAGFMMIEDLLQFFNA
jgi:hypothetical protein